MKARRSLLPGLLILLSLTRGYAADPVPLVESIDNSTEQGIAAHPIHRSSTQSMDAAPGEKPAATLTIDTGKRFQTMAGIGAAFNENGALALAGLPPEARDALVTNLFGPEQGAGFSMCRLPVGSSDFATSAYSYAETPGGSDHEPLFPRTGRTLDYSRGPGGPEEESLPAFLCLALESAWMDEDDWPNGWRRQGE
jgi:hypothetical protein